MATHVFGPDAKFYFQAEDLSTYTRALALEYSADAVDMTVCGNDTRVMAGGLKGWSLNAEGFYSVDEEDRIFSSVGYAQSTIGGDVIILPDGTSDGDTALFGTCMTATLQEFGEVGSLTPFSLTAVSGAIASTDQTTDLVRGSVGLVTSSTSTPQNGTGLNLGAVASGQTMFAYCQMLSVTGSALATFNLQSDSTDSWSGAETTHDTCLLSTTYPNTTAGMFKVGAETDEWWRIRLTITGSPSAISLVAVLGII